MEIFNIHIFEFLLIAGLALIVFGPERLPELGRFAGKQVARFLAWQQQSPELKMINDVRSEFEQEIAALRDELVRTRRQLDVSQDLNLNSLRDELRPMLNLRDELKNGAVSGRQPAASPPGERAPAPQLPAEGASAPPDLSPPPDAQPPALADLSPPPGAQPPALADLSPPPDLAIRPAPAGTVPAARQPNRLAATEPTTVLSQPAPRLSHPHDAYAGDDLASAGPSNGQAPPPALTTPAPPGLSATEVSLLLRQIESFGADLQILISELSARGLIAADWRPDAALHEQEARTR